MTAEHRARLLDLAARRLKSGGIITDDEAGDLAGELEARLKGAQRPIGGWYPADVLWALSG